MEVHQWSEDTQFTPPLTTATAINTTATATNIAKTAAATAPAAATLAAANTRALKRAGTSGPDPFESTLQLELRTLERDRKACGLDPESRAWGDLIAAEMNGLVIGSVKRIMFKRRLVRALSALVKSE